MPTTMTPVRRLVALWGRWITGGLVAALLFSQVALAAYACPKLDSEAHAASMQMADMAMEEAVAMASMPECHAMAGAMDDDAPHLCRAHCSGDSRPAPSLQGLDLQSIAAQAVWMAYVLPAVLAPLFPAEARATYAQADLRTGAPPIYLALQVLRN